MLAMLTTSSSAARAAVRKLEAAVLLPHLLTCSLGDPPLLGLTCWTHLLGLTCWTHPPSLCTVRPWWLTCWPHPPPLVLQMMEVPADMSRLTGLRQLSIEYCELAALPPCVQALPELEGLSLEGNCIANLPEGPYLQGASWGEGLVGMFSAAVGCGVWVGGRGQAWGATQGALPPQGGVGRWAGLRWLLLRQESGPCCG